MDGLQRLQENLQRLGDLAFWLIALMVSLLAAIIILGLIGAINYVATMLGFGIYGTVATVGAAFVAALVMILRFGPTRTSKLRTRGADEPDGARSTDHQQTARPALPPGTPASDLGLPRSTLIRPDIPAYLRPGPAPAPPRSEHLPPEGSEQAATTTAPPGAGAGAEPTAPALPATTRTADPSALKARIDQCVLANELDEATRLLDQLADLPGNDQFVRLRRRSIAEARKRA
jgi:hypothetical protein